MRIEIRDLTKVHPGRVVALSGVSLCIDKGLHGLLGPNGAGKTTLMKVLCTLSPPSSGTILVDGLPIAEQRGRLRANLGYLGQEWGAPRAARCGEVLDLMLRLRGVDDAKRRDAEVDRLLALVGLGEHRKAKVKTLSGGMVRRLGVAQALAGDPELIVMDEPTVGLDPDERVEFRNLLSYLGRERTILLSTHVVADVGTTCGQVTVLSQGKVVFDGTPDALRSLAAGQVFETVATPEREAHLRSTMTVVSAVPLADGARLRLVGSPPNGETLEPVEPGLEDAYLVLVPQASGGASWVA